MLRFIRFPCLLILVIALSAAACGRPTPTGLPSGESPDPGDRSTVSPSGAIAIAGADASESSDGLAETVTEASPFSQVTIFGWSEDEPGVTWTVTGGTAAVDGGRYCLTPSGADPVLARVPSEAITLTGGSGVGVLSAELLASTPDLAGASVGLAACGVLLELDDQARWRQTPFGTDLVVGAYGDWTAETGLAARGQHALGILCEAGVVTLVGDGAILAQIEASLDPTAPLALSATAPGGGVGVCFYDLRVEVWPEEQGGDDRLAILAELGSPDAFSIAFEQDPAGGQYRVETWFYAGAGMVLTIADRVLIETGGFDASSEELSAWPVDYDPLSFQGGMTLEAVQALLAGQELVSLEVPEEFGAGMVLYAGDQIVLGFSEGELEFVETLPITVDTYGGEP